VRSSLPQDVLVEGKKLLVVPVRSSTCLERGGKPLTFDQRFHDRAVERFYRRLALKRNVALLLPLLSGFNRSRILTKLEAFLSSAGGSFFVDGIGADAAIAWQGCDRPRAPEEDMLPSDMGSFPSPCLAARLCVRIDHLFQAVRSEKRRTAVLPRPHRSCPDDLPRLAAQALRSLVLPVRPDDDDDREMGEEIMCV
jgi:hypothetical protein